MKTKMFEAIVALALEFARANALHFLDPDEMKQADLKAKFAIRLLAVLANPDNR